jgi:hypothetical protein
LFIPPIFANLPTLHRAMEVRDVSSKDLPISKLLLRYAHLSAIIFSRP